MAFLPHALACSATFIAAIFSCSQGWTADPATYKHGVIIDLEGEIGPGLEQYVFRKLDAAKEASGYLWSWRLIVPAADSSSRWK